MEVQVAPDEYYAIANAVRVYWAIANAGQAVGAFSDEYTETVSFAGNELVIHSVFDFENATNHRLNWNCARGLCVSLILAPPINYSASAWMISLPPYQEE
jgi:hypothetical protein